MGYLPILSIIQSANHLASKTMHKITQIQVQSMSYHQTKRMEGKCDVSDFDHVMIVDPR